MPTYAYRCRDCGHQFDIFQKFSEDALTVCPVCQGTIRRVIQPTGVVFKGTGFYINDSRPSEKSSSSKKADDGGDAKAIDGAKAADAEKPAAKADTSPAADKPAARAETGGGSTSGSDARAKPADKQPAAASRGR
jgi:putative FmdB family regulatory protein